MTDAGKNDAGEGVEESGNDGGNIFTAIWANVEKAAQAVEQTAKQAAEEAKRQAEEAAQRAHVRPHNMFPRNPIPQTPAQVCLSV